MTSAATHQAMPAKLDRDQWTAGNLPFPAGCLWPISAGDERPNPTQSRRIGTPIQLCVYRSRSGVMQSSSTQEAFGQRLLQKIDLDSPAQSRVKLTEI